MICQDEAENILSASTLYGVLPGTLKITSVQTKNKESPIRFIHAEPTYSLWGCHRQKKNSSLTSGWRTCRSLFPWGLAEVLTLLRVSRNGLQNGCRAPGWNGFIEFFRSRNVCGGATPKQIQFSFGWFLKNILRTGR